MLNQYKILGSCVLEDFYSLPSSALYRFLKLLKKEVFAEDERIIFYNYQQIDSDLLDHLSTCLLRLDIPDFFVIVLSNQQFTLEYLKDKISVEQIDAPLTHKNKNKVALFNNNNQFCAHAWVGIHVYPDGTTRACCESNQRILKEDGTPYNIKDSSIETILASPWMQSLRNSFRNNERPDNCSTCWKRESLGQESRRTITPYKLENIYGYINWEEEDQLMYLGGHLGNICNLKCRICSSHYSSSIAHEFLSELPKERRKESTHYQLLKDAEWVQEDPFWEDIKSKTNSIKVFEFLGGEPFFLKKNIDFLNYVVENNLSQDMMFEFSTNSTLYPKIIDQAHKFNRLEITVSIDNVGERFELERHGASWEIANSNIKKMIQQQKTIKNFKVNLCVTLNVQNVYYLPEILEWIRSMDFNSYYFNFVNYPSYFSITNLTPRAKSQVVDRLNNFNATEQERKELNSVVEIINSSVGSDGIEFCNVVKRFDLIRNQDFSQTHTDIAKAMGYE
jgi:hypothetical protein